MMKYGAIIENALLFFAFIVFCGGTFAEIKIGRENQIADLKNNAESPIIRQGEDGEYKEEYIPSAPEDFDEFVQKIEEKLENATSPTSSSETTTAITTMLPATNESSTSSTTFGTTSLNIQSTSDFINPNVNSTSGSTQSALLANATEVSIVNTVNNSTVDANIKSDENAPKNYSSTLGWYSIFTTTFWKDQLYDQNYVLAIVLPIAAGISLALIVVCACCILNKLCNRQRHIHVEKKNYYGRNADSDNKWMLLAPSSSDEEI